MKIQNNLRDYNKEKSNSHSKKVVKKYEQSLE